MKHITLIAISLFIGHPIASCEPECILRIDGIPPKDTTQVWSPLFQASWDKLHDMQGGKLEKVVPPNDLITKLDEFKWQAVEVMPQDGYDVYVGSATAEFARETATTIKKRFNIDLDLSGMPLIPNGNVAYGILVRELKFEKEFFRSLDNSMKFQARTGKIHHVEFFGTAGNHSDDYEDHVKVLHYAKDASSFIFSVTTNQKGENLVIYRPDRECSFRDGIERVKKAMVEPLSGPYGSLDHGSLHRNDVVKIPYVMIDIDTDFTKQLSGEIHYFGGSLPWRVAGAFQVTKFELFEAGARVRVVSGVGMEPFGELPKPLPVIPRSFVCDQPFYVFLWRKGADWPYIAIWIDGEDCLTPFSK